MFLSSQSLNHRLKPKNRGSARKQEKRNSTGSNTRSSKTATAKRTKVEEGENQAQRAQEKEKSGTRRRERERKMNGHREVKSPLLSEDKKMRSKNEDRLG
ncbi:hypothetical protein Dimus_039620 [Dionaea muscipula]